MREIILEKLTQIEQDKQVKILYACESGSRAWGFASPDSDFDVRFIYIHQPDYYLSIDDGSDVIELPVNEVLDISGWDIRKALKLFRKSNPPLMEWLQSPIIYQKNDAFFDEIKTLTPDYYIPRNGFNHYLNMTQNTFEGSLQTDMVKLKKYFYALRPILACKWTVDKGELPPMEFDKLRSIITDSLVQQAFDDLLAQKIKADEKQTISPIKTLQDFIANTILYCVKREKETVYKNNNTEPLNTLFRKHLNESW